MEAAPAPRLRVRLTPPAEAALRDGHPWIYAEGIRELNREGSAGELAVIYDRKNRFLAIGLFDPDSPIRVRVLYAGKPRPLDAGWWQAHLRETVDRRVGLFGEETTGYRLCSGESDGWPGLVLDRYGETLVLKLYTAAWLPRLDEVRELLALVVPHERLVLRLSRNLAAAAGEAGLQDGMVLSGPALDGCVVFRENGIRFEADVLHGQKTGFFLDQRDNRARVEKLAQGRAVLNAFSYSGGFSLYAARGGATSVTNVDISPQALESGQRNVALNRADPAIRACPQEQVQADVFDWLRATEARFDLAILDPPSLARREAQRKDALFAYGRLARSGIERLRRGGILVAASCSAHVSADEFFSRVRLTARQSGRLFRELATTGHPPDHPATFPEAHYLKCIYLRLD
jgi:23S rRNA (cytosine1962-C5)-methyltransferase